MSKSVMEVSYLIANKVAQMTAEQQKADPLQFEVEKINVVAPSRALNVSVNLVESQIKQRTSSKKKKK